MALRPGWREPLGVALWAALIGLVLRGFVLDQVRVPSGSMAPTLLAGDRVLVWKAAYGVRLPFTHLRIVPLGAPRRGDVIVFESPREPGKDYVKRVVGLPGDRIELREQVLHVNGVPQPRTLVGEEIYQEPAPGGGEPLSEPCRRYREAVARGPLVGPAGDPNVEPAASWEAAAAAGVASYDVLQCRRPRLAAREGPFQVVPPGHVFVLGDNRDLSADSRGGGGWTVPVENVAGRAVRVLWSRGEGAGAPRLRRERLFKAVDSRY